MASRGNRSPHYLRGAAWDWDTPTPRQREILALVARGYDHAGAAAVLGLRPATVKRHLTLCYHRLGVQAAHQAVAVALARGYLAPDECGPPRPPALPSRARDVLALMGRGRTMRGVAGALGITEHAVRRDLQAVYRALGAQNVTRAIVLAVTGGHLDPAELVPDRRS